jgi:DMSO/TMAO reductase YedYZ molybdopterin-dependent catalytic subunit
VNKSAAGAGVVEAALDPRYRLVVEGRVAHRLELTIDQLRALPQREAVLPVACVEGWSAEGRWRGVSVGDLLRLAGARRHARGRVESLQAHSIYRTSPLNRRQIADRDTLLALELEGQPLHIDHGYPVRLIGPARPGVQQTKLVAKVVVL